MRNLVVAGILASLTGTAAAGPPPPELMATVSLTAGSGLDPIRTLANAIRPGTGLLLNDAILKKMVAGTAHATSLDGLDLTSWSYLLVADGGDVAVLGKVTDAKQLASGVGTATLVAKDVGKDHWAVIGPKRLTDKLGGYAFDVLAKQTPQTPTATIFAANVMGRYKQRLTDLRASIISTASAGQTAMASFLEADFDAVLSLAADTDRVVVTLDPSNNAATIDIAFVPVASSRLSKFIALQRPSDYGLLDKLPPTQAGLLLAGHLETGPYRDGMLDMMVRMYASLPGKELVTAVASIMSASTGELGMTADFSAGGLAMTQVFGLADTKAADASIGRLLHLFDKARTFDVMGYKTTFETLPKAPAYDGVALQGYAIKYDFAKLPPDQKARMEKMFPGDTHARLGLVDGTGMLVTGGATDAQSKLVIDAIRGKAAHFSPSKQVADLLAASRGRKDSMAFVMDFASLAAMMKQTPAIPGASMPGVLTLGFADKNLHLRIAASVATIKALAHL